MITTTEHMFSHGAFHLFLDHHRYAGDQFHYEAWPVE